MRPQVNPVLKKKEKISCLKFLCGGFSYTFIKIKVPTTETLLVIE